MRLTDEQVQALAEHYQSQDDDEMTWCLRELLELRQVVSKLPKTADGVSFIPQANGNLVWWCDRFGNAYWNRNVVQGGDDVWYAYSGWMYDGCLGSVESFDPDFNTCRPVADSYSTKEAALAARTLASGPHDHDHLEDGHS